MSTLPLTKPENISNLLNLDREYAAPAIVADNVLQKDWNAQRERSFKDPEGFWADYATLFEWSQPWSKVLEWDGVHHKWFTGHRLPQSRRRLGNRRALRRHENVHCSHPRCACSCAMAKPIPRRTI